MIVVLPAPLGPTSATSCPGSIVAASLRLAFPRVPLFRDACDEIAILAEMAADDVASRQHGADTIASALASLAQASARRRRWARAGTRMDTGRPAHADRSARPSRSLVRLETT